jgi:hypothetical protein
MFQEITGSENHSKKISSNTWQRRRLKIGEQSLGEEFFGRPAFL